ncbi:hypothetical protein [Legionella sainthelensi]|uniref:Uncharacterized protein n=1 Tax=Legionella sainthelensi TaxID=28087 RepID=A0A2H5FM33_9GAMM|nr:hypothetical protein [Legionella sainthelensi]AUH72615.1 hypothetical protein CAB17_11545 [Legionella sainthelensi]
MFKIFTKIAPKRLGKNSKTRRETPRFINDKKIGLWDAPSIKHSWLNINSNNEPHTLEGTTALKKLISDEINLGSENTVITSLPKGKKVVGFSPTRGVADHALVFDKIPDTPNFPTQIAPKITVKGSKLKNFEISSDVENCLSEKIEENSKSYLIHFTFLKEAEPWSKKIFEEKISNNFSFK